MKYRVILREITYKAVIVEADNPEDAEEEGIHDGGNPEYLDGGDTQVISVEEIKEA
jgi:hypothetical protein